MKKKLLSRIARRKDSAPAKPGEGHEIPPPTAIEPGVPHSTEDREGKSYGSHMELELLAADEPPRADLTNGVDARESEPAPAVESWTAPVPGEPPDAAETPREAAPFEEYGLDLEPLGEPEAGESPAEAETSGQDDEAFPVVAESVTEATAAGPEIPRESEPEAVADVVSEHEEAATDVAESPVEATASEPRIPQESVAQAIGDAVPEDGEPLAAAGANESPDAPEPSREAAPFEEYGLDLELLTEPGAVDSPGEPDPGEEQDEAVPVAGESAAEATAPEPAQEDEPDATVGVVSEHEEAATDVAESPVEAAASEPRIPQESEAQAIGDAVPEDGEPLAAASVNESPDAPEPSREAAPFEEYGLDLELLTEPGSGDAPGEPDPGEEQDEAVPVAGESVAEAAAPEPEIPLESESEPADNIVQEVEEPLAASTPEASPDESQPPRPEPSREDEAASHSEVLAESPPEQTDEPPETPLLENGFLPLVRDSRGNWRPGKGFSRSELREAGLTLAGAARLQIRLDKRRRNAHPVNVAALEKAKSGA